MALSEDERLKHSLIYEDSTSEIKDDIVQLVSCLKLNSGALTRQQSAFLLWYHAMSNEEKAGELVTNNAVNVCLTIIDSPDSSPVDKSTCAGILCSISQFPEHKEPVIKGKSPGSAASVVLHSQLKGGQDLVVQYCIRTLRLIAEDPAGRPTLLKQMEQKLIYHDLYLEVLYKCIDSTSICHMCGLLKALLLKRDDLKGEAIEHGLVEALLHVARTHKAPATICTTLGCLYELTLERESWQRIIKADGLKLLVDALGPPPSSIMKHEMSRWRHILEPEYANALKKKQAEWFERKKQSKLAGGAEVKTPQSASRPVRTQDSAVKGPAIAVPPITGEDDPRPESPERDDDPNLSDLLSHNSCALKWGNSLLIETYTAAAGCLYELCQNTDYMHMASRRMAACRLVPLLQAAMEVEGDGKKKGKKKGLTLSPQQTEALSRITGCLKFLSLVNSNRYRIAQLGAAKYLIPIYEECGHTLLRRNAQFVLSNIAMMAENGQILLESKLPEEFLVVVPMRLSQEEVDLLATEFPDKKVREMAKEAKDARAAAALVVVDAVVAGASPA